jgi:hypothetical protein
MTQVSVRLGPLLKIFTLITPLPPSTGDFTVLIAFITTIVLAIANWRALDTRNK